MFDREYEADVAKLEIVREDINEREKWRMIIISSIFNFHEMDI